MLDKPCRLVFGVYSTKYLGTEEIAATCLTILKQLPKKFVPTKMGNDDKKQFFSLHQPENFLTMIPGEHKEEGQVYLYKVRDLFNFGIYWKKLSLDELAKYPGKRYNSINITTSAWESCLADEKDFLKLKQIWLQFCTILDAIYGYCAIEDATQNWVRGFGNCLPRLYWKTYFGEPYINALNLDEIRDDRCTISDCENGILLEISSDPKELVYPRTPLEDRLISVLGDDYFWNNNDNSRIGNGKFNYKLPNLDMSEIILD